MTDIFKKYRDSKGSSLTLDYAGKDVTHLFNQWTRDPIVPDKNLREKVSDEYFWNS